MLCWLALNIEERCIFSFILTLRPLENNKPPVADAGPEKELTLPVDRTTLDGSKSSDDQKIATYSWKQLKSVANGAVNSRIQLTASEQNKNCSFYTKTLFHILSSCPCPSVPPPGVLTV